MSTPPDSSARPTSAAAPAAPAPAPTPAPSAPAASPTPPPRSIFAIIIFILIALAGILVVLYAWRLPPFVTPLQSTENAQVRGQVTLISPQLSGYITQVTVQDFQQVKQGELLVKIDDRIFKQKVAQAEAQVAAQKATLSNSAQQSRSAQASINQARAGIANARAQAEKAAADLKRIDALVADGSLSIRERDQARAAQATAVAGSQQTQAAVQVAEENLRSVSVNKEALEAAVANAEAALELARIDLANTEIRAPVDGQLGLVGVRLGAYVNAGTQLMALVPTQKWIVANMKETQMANIQPGQPASFTVDALEHAKLRGVVERISPAAGSEFSVIAPDNATGNFVKIAQRIPVRISIDNDQPLAASLRPGMSVVVSIDTSVTPDGARAAQ